MKFFHPEITLLMCEYPWLEHWHYPLIAPYWRIYHNDEPGGALEFRGERIALQPDRIYLIAPETDAVSVLEAPFHHLYIHFTARFPYDYPAPGVYSVPYAAAAHEMVEAIKIELDREDVVPLRLSLLAAALSHFMLTFVPETALENPIEDRRVLKTLKYIHAHYQDKIGNGLLAEMAAMNINAFIRLFTRTTGRSPQQYILEHRLRKACILLQYSAKTIDEIAEETGFCNRYYFSRLFSRSRRISPARFRTIG